MIIHLMGGDFLDTDEMIINSIEQPLPNVLPPPVIKAKRKTKHRNHAKVLAWRQEVLTRDGHKCRECGTKENLQVHHHTHYSKADLSAHDFVFNGSTLCCDCHAKRHPELPEGVRRHFNKYTIAAHG